LSSSYGHLRDDLNFITSVDLDQMNADVVTGGRRDVLAHEVGADRKLAVSAVDEDGEANGARTAVVDERVHRGADGPASEEHVVDENHHASVDRERDLRLAHHRRVSDARQVVAVERDIDRAERHVDALVGPDGGLDARRQRVATRADTDDGETGEVTVALDDLVRDTRDGPADVVRRK
jgi:hypothetical protein